MSDPKHDTGVILVLLKRLKESRLPYALALKEKVDKGSALNQMDDRFLEEVRDDLRKTESLLERNPEYQDLISRTKELYTQIIEQATINEGREMP